MKKKCLLFCSLFLLCTKVESGDFDALKAKFHITDEDIARAKAAGARVEAWEIKVQQLKVKAIHGNAQALHQLFLETQSTDGSLTDTLGEALAVVRDAKPRLYGKVFQKEAKEIQELIDFHTAVARSEPGD